GLKAIVLMGNEQQKKQFLPRLAKGEILAAFCLSEPEVGSDAANVQTTARLSEDGKYWILNGQKKFATNAALAGVMTVMAKTPVAEPASDKPAAESNGNGNGHGNGNGNGNGNGHNEPPKIKEKITAFIVTPDLPGFEI